MAFSL